MGKLHGPGCVPGPEHAPDARTIILEGSLTLRVGLVGTGPVDQVIAAFLEHALSETHYFGCTPDAEAWARAA